MDNPENISEYANLPQYAMRSALGLIPVYNSLGRDRTGLPSVKAFQTSLHHSLKQVVSSTQAGWELLWSCPIRKIEPSLEEVLFESNVDL